VPAGIDRQLDRRAAMQAISITFAGLGDLHSELTALGRYVVTVIDQESELLQIAARTRAPKCVAVKLLGNRSRPCTSDSRKVTRI